jgi:hypothetical protein
VPLTQTTASSAPLTEAGCGYSNAGQLPSGTYTVSAYAPGYAIANVSDIQVRGPGRGTHVEHDVQLTLHRQ